MNNLIKYGSIMQIYAKSGNDDGGPKSA